MSLGISLIKSSCATDGKKVDAEYFLREKQKVLQEKQKTKIEFATVYDQFQRQQGALNNFKKLLERRVKEVQRQPRKEDEYAEYQEYCKKVSAFEKKVSEVDSYYIKLLRLNGKIELFMSEHWKEDIEEITKLQSVIDPFYRTMQHQCSECNRLLKVFSQCIEKSGLLKTNPPTLPRTLVLIESDDIDEEEDTEDSGVHDLDKGNNRDEGWFECLFSLFYCCTR